MLKAVEVIGHSGVPVGAMVTFLLIALVAATQRGVRHGGGKRETRRMWNLWLLGPATVLSLLCALFIAWKLLIVRASGGANDHTAIRCKPDCMTHELPTEHFTVIRF